jgi:hypothetical protein
VRVVLRFIAATFLIIAVLSAKALFEVGIPQAIKMAGYMDLTSLQVIGWPIAALLGPIAAIQLWRLRPSGLLAAALLCAFGVLKYGLALYFRTEFTAPPYVPSLIAFIWALAGLVMLVIPKVRRLCAESPNNRIERPREP